MSKVAFLFVSCCLEPLRAETLGKVVDNMKEQMPSLLSTVDVFDNASTQQGIVEFLINTFKNVYVANKNIGYWSAIWWWLDQLVDNPPDYTYIIESDMVHYDFHRFWDCVLYLDKHPDVGSVRVQRYSYAERDRYNKDKPRQDSYINDLQSHTNHVTGSPVVFFDKNVGGILESTFLTKLPALNRYATMKSIFDELLKMKAFTELDFQRLYWEKYERTGVLDLGIYHCDFTGYGVKNITGSWTDPNILARIGYLPTRQAIIMAPDLYTVTKLT